MVEERYLTIQEVMAMLKVSDETVYRYIQKGTLRGVRFGTLWRVGEGSLVKFLADSAATPLPPRRKRRRGDADDAPIVDPPAQDKA